MRLHLRHKVHDDHNYYQQCSPAKLERYVELNHQELRHQANCRDVQRSEQRQPGENRIYVARRLISRPVPGNKCARFLQIIRNLFRVKHDCGIPEAEKDNPHREKNDIEGLPRRNLQTQFL
jgi:hypothetical protein